MRRLMKRLVRRQHKGQSIIVLALGMVALLGFVGITTDISLLFVRYATLRRAVDAAAIAAAGQMRQDRSIATVNLTARSYIEIHGLNPRDVWVESCQNQPRPDNDPIAKGMQMAPPSFVLARDAYLNAYDDLEEAISGGTVGLATLKDLYVNNARAYIDSLSSFAEGESDAVNALETAARAALASLSGYSTDVDITANFVATNAAVIAYAQDVAEFLPEDWTDDLEICTADQRKLVRVTAQVESPTVFLRLFGWQNILLEASAVSETAVLDVVIVMDVSESMMFDTVIKDWEAVHMAVAYLPPRIENTPTRIYADTKTVLGRMIGNAVIPSWTGFGASTAETRAPDDTTAKPPISTTFPYTAPPPRGGGVVNTYADTYETWLDGWFWGEYLLGVPQSEVNRRLFYLDIGQPLNGEASATDQSVGGPMGTYPAPTDPDVDYNDPRNQYYQVRSFIPDNVTDPLLQTQPREACRVRFYPFSMNSYMDPTLAEMYVTELGVTNADWPSIQNYTTANPSDDAKWSGFVPSFNFYGCCNDPSYAVVDRDGSFLDPVTGNPFGSNSNNWSNDNRFDDLVCQPMKQARDATRLFLERVDFLRGDRVGFVTFDKSAYIIDPDGANGKPGFANLSHMIEDLDTATKVLNQAIGVRAEPNYYVWNEDGGIFTAGPWTGTGTATQFAAGYNQDNEVLPVDYDCTNADCPPPPMDNFGAPEIDQSAIDPSYLNYPVAGNCSIQNAELQFPYSRFATRNTGNAILDNQNTPSLYRIFNPPAYGVGSQPLWSSYSNSRSGGPLTTNHSYEKQGTCRGTNIGAALRVGNDALTDPRTTRRAGTVWIMILLSDGAAGASDPVRQNGQKVDQAVPYEEIRRFDWRQRTSTTSNNRSNEYGAGVSATTGAIIGRGGYGWLGLCPFGTPAVPGQLIKNPTGLSFPFCSDPDVVSRHFCLANPGQSVGYPDFGSGFDPGSFDRDYRDRVIATVLGEAFDPPANVIPAGWNPFDAATQTEGDYILEENTRLGNIFDVDLGTVGASSCDPLYDVDDYARDWADFVAGVDEEQSGDAVLPTIFTIGFRLEFVDTPHAPSNLTCEQRVGNNDSPEYDKCMCNLNIEQCLGEELLRYIADAGDNFVIDNDLQQDWRNHNDFTTQINLDKDVTEWGPKDPCENPSVNWFDAATTLNDFAPRRGGQSCGNYYNAPSVTELQQVFDDIASRMFTRLAG
ncbi:MAG: pilus assembly protein TadG-related protein [bacterium]|nr:pilus assembly protein TadG-related protein [bacterium]